MTDNFEKKVAVDGPVVNAGELGSSTFSPGQALPAGPLGLGQRWTVARKREVVLRLLRDEPVQLLSRQLGVEIFRLEQWREKAIGGIDASLKQRKGDPVQAELDSAAGTPSTNTACCRGSPMSRHNRNAGNADRSAKRATQTTPWRWPRQGTYPPAQSVACPRLVVQRLS